MVSTLLLNVQITPIPTGSPLNGISKAASKMRLVESLPKSNRSSLHCLYLQIFVSFKYRTLSQTLSPTFPGSFLPFNR